MFLVPNEFLISINPGTYWEPFVNFALSLKDRTALREVGIQTSIEYLDWGAMEPEKGVYDFSSIEEMLKLNRGAGQKTILSAPGEKTPMWMPNEWMVKSAGGKVEVTDGKIGYRVLSLWNEEAQKYLRDYLSVLVKQYSAPDVLFILSEYQGGEAILPCEPFYYDEYALTSYKKIYGNDAYPRIITHIDEMRKLRGAGHKIIFSTETKVWLQATAIQKLIKDYRTLNQHKEIWNQQQSLMNDWSESTINYAQKDILRAYKEAFPDSNITLMQYTYFDSAHTDVHKNYVDGIKEEFQCDVIVEAHYCSGLPTTTPASIARGFRGQVVGTAHGEAETRGIESWMLDAIRTSHNQWLESLA